MIDSIFLWIYLAGFLTFATPYNDEQIVQILEDKGLQVESVKDKGVYVYLPKTEFAFDVYELTSEQRSALKAISEVLKLNGIKRRFIYIEGHTDKTGSEEYNMELSLKRAEAVRDELLKLDIGSERMNAVGYGSKYPLSEKDSDNRRVQLLIYNR